MNIIFVSMHKSYIVTVCISVLLFKGSQETAKVIKTPQPKKDIVSTEEFMDIEAQKEDYKPDPRTEDSATQNQENPLQVFFSHYMH